MGRKRRKLNYKNFSILILGIFVCALFLWFLLSFGISVFDSFVGENDINSTNRSVFDGGEYFQFSSENVVRNDSIFSVNLINVSSLVSSVNLNDSFYFNLTSLQKSKVSRDVVFAIESKDGGDVSVIVKKKSGSKGGVLKSVDVGAKELGDILDDDDVEGVYPNREYYMLLDTSDEVLGSFIFYDSGYNGSGVNVAVLDTGIDKNHPFLEGKVVLERSFVGTDVMDYNGHGTHVAGIIGGSNGNFTGVALGVNLINVKVLADDGSGSTESISNGINWAVENGADVISMSLGAPFYTTDEIIDEAILNAINSGVVVVVASGNCNSGACSSFKGVTYPGFNRDVITVGAVSDEMQDASFSSGQDFGSYIKPDVVSLGVDVLSSYLGGSYARKGGTSMSTPHVSGVVSLLLSRDSSLSHFDVKDLLESRAIDLGESGKDVRFGSGFVSLEALFYDNSSLGNDVLVVNETGGDNNYTSVDSFSGYDGYWVPVESGVNVNDSGVVCPENYYGYSNSSNLSREEFYYLFEDCVGFNKKSVNNLSSFSVLEIKNTHLEDSSSKVIINRTRPKMFIKMPVNATLYVLNENISKNLNYSRKELLKRVDFSTYESAFANMTSTNLSSQELNVLLEYDDSYDYRSSSSDGIVWGGKDLAVRMIGSYDMSYEVACFDWYDDGTYDNCYGDSQTDFDKCMAKSSVLKSYCLEGKCYKGVDVEAWHEIGTGSPGDMLSTYVGVKYYGDCGQDDWNIERDLDFKWSKYYVVSPRQYDCKSDNSGYEDIAWFSNDYVVILDDYSCGSDSVCDSSRDDDEADFGFYGTSGPASPCRLKEGGNCYGDNNACLTNYHCSVISGPAYDHCCPNGEEWIDGSCQVVCVEGYTGSKRCGTDGIAEWEYRNLDCSVTWKDQSSCSEDMKCSLGTCVAKTCSDFSGTYGSCSQDGIYKKENNGVFECEDMVWSGEILCWKRISELGDDNFCSNVDCGYNEWDCDYDSECSGSLECKGELSGDADGCCNSNQFWDDATHKCFVPSCSDYSNTNGACTQVGSYKKDGIWVYECVEKDVANQGSILCWEEYSEKGEDDFCSKVDCNYNEWDCDGGIYDECSGNLICTGEIGGSNDGCCFAGEFWDSKGHDCFDPCVILGFSWSQSEANSGDKVSLIVDGGGSCAGRKVNATIHEDDIYGDDDVDVFSGVFSSVGDAKFEWNAKWIADASGDPEYYFTIYVDEPGDNDIEDGPSGMLEVHSGVSCTSDLQCPLGNVKGNVYCAKDGDLYQNYEKSSCVSGQCVFNGNVVTKLFESCDYACDESTDKCVTEYCGSGVCDSGDDMYSCYDDCKVELVDFGISPSSLEKPGKITLSYKIFNPSDSSVQVGLGGEIKVSGGATSFEDSGDVIRNVGSGSGIYTMDFDILASYPSSYYDVLWRLWSVSGTNFDRIVDSSSFILRRLKVDDAMLVCSYPYGYKGCECSSDLQCDDNEFCDFSLDFNMCAKKPLHDDVCSRLSSLKCKSDNNLYRCEITKEGYQDWVYVFGCKRDEFCSESEGKCVLKGDYDLILEDAPSGVVVNKQYGTILEVNIKVTSGALSKSLVYDESAFYLVSGSSCASNSFSVGDNFCYFEVIDEDVDKEYEFGFGDDRQSVKIVSDDVYIAYLTDAKQLAKRYASDEVGVSVLLAKLYIEAAKYGGVVYDMETQFKYLDGYGGVSNPFAQMQFSSYDERLFSSKYTDNSYTDSVALFTSDYLSDARHIVVVGDDYVLPQRREGYGLGDVLGNEYSYDMYTDQHLVQRQTYSYSDLKTIFSAKENTGGVEVKFVVPDVMSDDLKESLDNLRDTLVSNGYAEDHEDFSYVKGSLLDCNDFELFKNRYIFSSSAVLPILVGDHKDNPAYNCYPTYDFMSSEDDFISVEPSVWNGDGASILMMTQSPSTIDIFTNKVIKEGGFEYMHGSGYIYFRDVKNIGIVAVTVAGLATGITEVGGAIIIAGDIIVSSVDAFDECYYRDGVPDSFGDGVSCSASLLPFAGYGLGQGIKLLKVKEFKGAVLALDDIDPSFMTKLLAGGGDKSLSVISSKIPSKYYDDFIRALDVGMKGASDEAGVAFAKRFVGVLEKSSITKRTLRDTPEILDELGSVISKYDGASDDVLEALGNLLSKDGKKTLARLKIIGATDESWSKLELEQLAKYDDDVVEMAVKHADSLDSISAFPSVKLKSLETIEKSKEITKNFRKYIEDINPNLIEGKEFGFDPDFTQKFELVDTDFIAYKNKVDGGIIVYNKKTGRFMSANSETGHLFDNVFGNYGLKVNLRRESKMYEILIDMGDDSVFVHKLEAQFPDMAVFNKNGIITDLANTGPYDDWAKIGNKIDALIKSDIPLENEVNFYIDFNADLTIARKSSAVDVLGNPIYTLIENSNLDVIFTDTTKIIVNDGNKEITINFIQKGGGEGW